MRTAVISDVHGNLEALVEVLNDISMQKADKIICLGDTIGYGADPEECIDIVRSNCDVVLQGNHENAVTGKIENDAFRQQAADSVILTKARLAPKDLIPDFGYKFTGEEGKESEKEERWMFMQRLPTSYEENGVMYVHGSPRDPVMEYFSSGDIAILNLNSRSLPDDMKKYYGKRPSMYKAYRAEALRKLHENFGIVERLAWCGHNHIPCINSNLGENFKVEGITDDGEKSKIRIRFPDSREMLVEEIVEGGINDWYAYMFPSEEYGTNVFQLGHQKSIINVGAVGQPRNCDPRASYFVYDDRDNTVECRRVSYDFEAAMRKIKMWGNEGMTAGLITHDFDKLAERLGKGE